MERAHGKALRSASTLVLALILLVGGCVASRERAAVVPAVGSSTSSTIGETGGTLRIDDLVVTIPAGALTTPTEIQVFVEAPSAGEVFTAFSPVVRLEPEGLELAQPIELRIPFAGDGRAPGAFGERADGGAVVALDTSLEGDVAIIRTTSLGDTFVGTACDGDDCELAPNGQLDLLVVIDDSGSMAEEQTLLREQLPLLFQTLASGDLDHDGIQDVPAFDSIRVGVTTTDMGGGSIAGVPTCDVGFGDDGILMASSSSAPECVGATASIAEYASSVPASIDGFVDLTACNADRGIGGCGFEQQLEAALLALSPSAATAYTSPSWSAPIFVDGRVGQGDAGNAAFLRDDSILAVLWVTDEEDCSLADASLVDPSDGRYAGVSLNLRCHEFPDTLQPVQRFVDGLVGLRHQPEDVIVAAIAGTPSGFDTTPGAIDYDALLADDSMQETVDPVSPDRLMPACSGDHGIAFPARRIVSALRGIDEAGGRVVLQSICDPSFAQLTNDLATQLGERAAGGS